MTHNRARTASNIPLSQMPKDVQDAVAEEQAAGPRPPRKQEARATGWSQGYPEHITKAMAAMEAEETKQAEMAKRKSETKEQDR